MAATEAKREALEATERTRTTEAKERIEELKQELNGIKIALEEERKGRVEEEKQLAGKKTEISNSTESKNKIEDILYIDNKSVLLLHILSNQTC